jgi:hypothetical protein
VLGLGRTRLPRSDRFSRRRHSNPRSGPLASDVVLRIHTHLSGSANAVPRIPDELRRARDRSADELDGTGAWRLLALGLVMAFGLALELGFRRLTSRWVDVEARDRMRQPEGRHRLHGVRLAVALGGVLTFAVASSGAFLLIEWPALARESVLSILITVVIARLALAAVRSALEPHGAGPEGRLVEVDDAAVRFWQPRITLFIGYFAAGYIAVMLARTYGLSPEVSRLTAYALGLGLLAIAIEATWRRPARRSDVEGAQSGCGRGTCWYRPISPHFGCSGSSARPASSGSPSMLASCREPFTIAGCWHDGSVRRREPREQAASGPSVPWSSSAVRARCS